MKVATPMVTGLAEIIKAMADARRENEGFWASLWAGMRTTQLFRDRRKDYADIYGGAWNNAAFQDPDQAAKQQLPGKETGPKPDEIVKDMVEQARLLYETGKASIDAYIVALDDAAEHYQEDSLKRLQYEKQLQDALQQERDKAAREEAVEMGEELAAIQKGVYWTRQEKISALEALLEKYRQLGEDAPNAYQRIQLAIIKTLDESESLEQGLAKTCGGEHFNKNVIEGFKGVRGSMAANYAEILKGQETLGDGIRKVWRSVGDSMIKSVSNMLADERMKGLLELVGLKPGTSNVSWMQGVWAYLKSSFAGVTDALGQGFKAVFGAVSEMVGGLLDSVARWLSDAVSGLGGEGGGFGGILGSIGSLFTGSAGSAGAGSAAGAAGEAGAIPAQHAGEHHGTRTTLFTAAAYADAARAPC